MGRGGGLKPATLNTSEASPMASNHAAFRVFEGAGRPSDDLVAPFRDVPTGNVCDAMDRFGALDYRIQALAPEMRLCGPALTVRTRPGDNVALYKAIEVAQPGDVLVIATYEYLTASTFGDLFVRGAQMKGVAGIVSDGLCRDVREIREVGLPVFVRGTSPASPFKDGPGEIGGAVSIGGVPVQAGDLVVGDEDGVVVVPQRDLARTAEKLKAVRKKEAEALARIEAGTAVSEAVLARIEALGTEEVGR